MDPSAPRRGELLTRHAFHVGSAQPDLTHEDRLLILGSSAQARVLFVVYVEREADDVVRIISARKATPHERKAYESQ